MGRYASLRPWRPVMLLLMEFTGRAINMFETFMLHFAIVLLLCCYERLIVIIDDD
jgi:hypothetical protein